MGNRVFNGLAHFIKGSIFFLYGIITLGRWLGAFSELGWVLTPSPNQKEKPERTFSLTSNKT
jgi:hypothetical protein